MDIVFATKNEGKLREIREIMSGFKVFSMSDAGVDIDVLEDGTTYEENALKKATEIMKATRMLTLADDSGLEIDYLDKAPGVYSARYLGEATPYDIKNKQILDQLENVPHEKRAARFVCAIAAAFPDGREPLVTRATLEGTVAYEAKGENGFGYDPILFLEEYGMTSAQITIAEKNAISHRGKALRKMRDMLLELYS